MIKGFRILYVSFSFLFLLIILFGCTGPTTILTPTPSSTLSPIYPRASADFDRPTTTPTPTPSTLIPLVTPAPVLSLAPTLTLAPTAQLQWLGHSAFLVTSTQGTNILIDPPNAGTGYVITPVDGADAVLVTHEHSDHNNVSLVMGSPLILRGLTSTGWNAVDHRVKDIHIYSISPVNSVYHDSQQGAQRGRNTIFVLEVDGLRLAHLGDLGHVLTPEIVQAIGALDVALIPVGGYYTIDATAATQVVAQLNPRVVIPMHYKTLKMQANWPGVGIEPFLEGKRVERPNSTLIRLSRPNLPAQTTVVVLNYE